MAIAAGFRTTVADSPGAAFGGVRFHLSQRLDFDIAAVHRFVTQLQPAGSFVPPLAGTAVYWGVLARY